MDKVCEELGDAKAEIEKLRADCKSKTELSQSLKKAHNEQLIKIQEASSTIEKQANELYERTEEISVMKQMYEDIKGSLNEKESIIKRLSAANDKLRVDCDEKYKKWEEENRGLVLALDEANEKNIDQEQKINVLNAEIEGLKGLLSASQKKCMETEKKAKAVKEMRERDDILFKLEEEKRTVDDQLKWKKEQFKHLEEAHEKLRDQFRTSKKEWELEKCTLLDEIFSLQTSLDSQTRISEDLQSRLQMCNQALSHEETRRKFLEVEVSEFRTRFENVFAECRDAKSQLECLTAQRDTEIAALRHSLGTKEIFYKEMEYQAGKLEQENQELLTSLKELREAQIHEAGNSSSLGKLRNKLKTVEQMYRDCSANLRAKEAEWSSQREKMTGDLNNYKSDLECKDRTLKELKMELEDCHSIILQLKLQNEEISVMLLVLKLGISEAQLKVANVEAEMGLQNKERSENVSLLMKQLEMKNTALARAQSEIDEEREKAASLLRRVESLDGTEEQRFLMQKEIERYKEMLEESSRCQLRLKEQALQMESDFEEKLRDVCDALDTANCGLAEEREKAASLLRRVECLDHIEEKRFLMQKELERCTEMLKESTACQLRLEEQALQIENDSKEKLRVVCDALDVANLKLAEELEKATSLSRRVESLELIEEQQLLMQREVERYKNMLEESSQRQLHLEKQALQTESDSQEKLRVVCDALDTADSKLAEELEKTASLLRRVESLDLIEEQQLLMQKELERYKKMLEESSRSQLHLEEQALQKESDFKRKHREVCDALDRANSELAEKICEGHEIEFELWIWKSIVENLKVGLEENQELRKELETSLLAQVEVGETIKQEKDGLACLLGERDSKIGDLQQQIVLLEDKLKTRESEAASSARMESAISFESEKETFLHTTKEKDMILEALQREIGWLERESLKRELEGVLLTQIRAEQTFEHEKENLIQQVEEKDQRVDDLLQLMRSLEHKFNNSLNSFSSQLAEKQAEINLVHEAWEKIAAAEILAELEIEEKKLMVVELEDDIFNIQKKLELQEKSLSHSKKQAWQIESELKAKQLEMKKLTNQMESKLRTSDALIDELRSEKRNLVEDVMKLSSERENLLGFIGGLGDRISKFSSEDVKLMGILGRLVQSFDNNQPDVLLKSNGELFDSVKENLITPSSPSTKKVETILEERSPFRQLN